MGVNREACAEYKRALDKYLPPEWSVAVYSENPNDVEARRTASSVVWWP